MVSFEVTYECNNSCNYCYNYCRDKKIVKFIESNLEEKKKVLKEIWKEGTFIINYTGGEPTIFSDLIELVQYGKELGFHQTLNTNARLISPKFADKLKGAGIIRAKVALCGSNAFNHDRQTKVDGSWIETINGINTLLESGISVTINQTLTKENFYDIENIARLSKSLGAEFSISRFIPHDQKKDYLTLELSNYEIYKIIKSIKKLRHEEIDVSLSTPIPYCAVKTYDIQYIKPCQCSAGVITCVIAPDLSVRACPMNNNIAGSLHFETFKEIWSSDKMNLWLDQSFFPNKCTFCSFFSLCRGGCRQAASFRKSSKEDPLIKSKEADNILNNNLDKYYHKSWQKISSKDVPKIIKKNIYKKEGFGATILFDDNSYIFLIGDVSCTIWNSINNNKNIDEIVNLISLSYKEDIKNIETDCIDFLMQLILFQAVVLNEN